MLQWVWMQFKFGQNSLASFKTFSWIWRLRFTKSVVMGLRSDICDPGHQRKSLVELNKYLPEEMK